MTDYGMYTVDGNMEVNLIVTAAKELGWDWPKVYTELEMLASELFDFGEAMDTVVRESVYKELGFTTPFYI